MDPRPPSSTLSPYAALLRSAGRWPGLERVVLRQDADPVDERRLHWHHRDDVLGLARSVAQIAAAPTGAALDRLVALLHAAARSEENTSELSSRQYIVCRLLF